MSLKNRQLLGSRRTALGGAFTALAVAACAAAGTVAPPRPPATQRWPA